MQPGVGRWTAICNVTCSVAWQRVSAASEPFEATCSQRDAAYWQHVSLHFRPWASLLSSVSNLVARHFTLSPFLYFPFGAMTDGDDANEKFCHKMLRHG